MVSSFYQFFLAILVRPSIKRSWLITDEELKKLRKRLSRRVMRRRKRGADSITVTIIETVSQVSDEREPLFATQLDEPHSSYGTINNL